MNEPKKTYTITHPEWRKNTDKDWEPGERYYWRPRADCHWEIVPDDDGNGGERWALLRNGVVNSYWFTSRKAAEDYCEEVSAGEILPALTEVPGQDELILKLREALKGCLPTLEDALQDARSHSMIEKNARGELFGKVSVVLVGKIAEIRALLGEDARKEGL